MNIIIGTNTYGNYHRQTIATESWNDLKIKFPNIVDIVDIQFKDEEDIFENHYNLNVKFDLERSSLDLFPDSQKKLPFVNDIIKHISKYTENEDDYFIFTNSDVVINSNLIKYIIDNKPECFACSRLDIENISSFQNLKNEIKIVRWEIAGFDTFIFKKSWYMKWSYMFNDYLLGKPEFDHVYAFIMKAYGDNTPFGNHYPPFCFHIHHGLASVTTECPELHYNRKVLKENSFDTMAARIMFYHLKYNLIKRKPWGAFLEPEKAEKQFEYNFFKNFNINHTPNFRD